MVLEFDDYTVCVKICIMRFFKVLAYLLKKSNYLSDELDRPFVCKSLTLSAFPVCVWVCVKLTLISETDSVYSVVLGSGLMTFHNKHRVHFIHFLGSLNVS